MTKLMIKISDEDYDRIKNIPDVFDCLTSRIYTSIKNGTVISDDKKEDLPPKNWSGIWIDRRDAMLEIEDRIDDYREYTNDYEKGKYDAYVEAEDVITSLDGHD